MIGERLQDDAGAMVGPPPLLSGFFGSVAAKTYGAVIAARNRRFDAGVGVVTFDRPVISVGNLSVGGTGKTPLVKRVCHWLTQAGLRPVIALRGYKASLGRSDEAELYAAALPGVPVVVGSDRAAGLSEFFGTLAGEGADCVVLDDGFQHRRIARCCDIVLVDSTRPPFTDRLLPAGWLREPVASLARADAVVLTHGEARSRAGVVALEARLWDVSRRFITAATRHHWNALRSPDGESVGVDRLRGARYMLVCAIGNPSAFRAEAVRVALGEPTAELILRDHDPYGPSTIRRMMAMMAAVKPDVLLVTEKDWTKLATAMPANEWPCPVWRPHLEIVFDRGEAALRALVIAKAMEAKDRRQLIRGR